MSYSVFSQNAAEDLVVSVEQHEDRNFIGIVMQEVSVTLLISQCNIIPEIISLKVAFFQSVEIYSPAAKENYTKTTPKLLALR